MPLSFFAAIGTKKEKAILTWTHEQLYPRIVKAKILLYTLVDERWDLARGERDTQNHALLKAFLDPLFKNDEIWVQLEIQMAEDGFVHLVS